MAMRNKQIFHDFFYSGGEEHYGNVSYNGDRFYSYQTQIGKKYTDDDGVDWLFVADHHFSTTTASHRSALIDAWPNSFEWVVEVPFHLDDSFVDDSAFFKTMRERFEKLITGFLEEDLLTVDYKRRIEVRKTLFHYRRFMNVLQKKITKKFQRALNRIDELVEPSKERKAKIRAALKRRKELECKRIKRARKQLDMLSDKLGGLLKVIYASSPRSSGVIDDPIRQQCKEALKDTYQGDNYPSRVSYVFSDSSDKDDLITSQGVFFPRKLAWLYLKRWHSGEKFGSGTKIGMYTIRNIDDLFVDIGCHHIPIDNIKALYEHLETIYGGVGTAVSC